MTRKVPSLGAKYSHPQRVRNHPQLFLQAVPLENIAPPKQGAGIWVQPTVSGINTIERVGDTLAWQEKDLRVPSKCSPQFRPTMGNHI